MGMKKSRKRDLNYIFVCSLYPPVLSLWKCMNDIKYDLCSKVAE